MIVKNLCSMGADRWISYCIIQILHYFLTIVRDSCIVFSWCSRELISYFILYVIVFWCWPYFLNVTNGNLVLLFVFQNVMHFVLWDVLLDVSHNVDYVWKSFPYLKNSRCLFLRGCCTFIRVVVVKEE